ncbi:MAG: hypothetical protein U0470_06430 [Anaerolineae bacterium]
MYAGIGRSVTKPLTSVEGHFGLRRGADGGASWTEYPYDRTTGDRLGGGTPFRDFEVPSLAVGPAGGLVWASVWGQALCVSKDHGGQWHRLRLPNRATPYFDAGHGPRQRVVRPRVRQRQGRPVGPRRRGLVDGRDRAHDLSAVRGAPWEQTGPSAATRPAPHGGLIARAGDAHPNPPANPATAAASVSIRPRSRRRLANRTGERRT